MATAIETPSQTGFAPPPPFGSGYPAAPVVAHLSAQPGIQKVPSPKLILFVMRHFIPADLCRELMVRIDAERRPSTVSDFNGDDAFRTSETCDFRPDEHLTQLIDTKIAGFMNLDPAHGETLQGQRYGVGQEFKAHTDYFDPLGVDWEKFCGVAGQRTWTAMIYLNEPGAGGATRFKVIDKTIHPETGKLLIWNNLNPDGSGNAATLHHGMKVRLGAKFVLTKWFRERPWR